MIDILFLAHNRLEFTQASFEALIVNTNWNLVGRLNIYNDVTGGKSDGTLTHLFEALRVSKIGADIDSDYFGSPVAAMQTFLDDWPDHRPAPLFAKIDNDVIVPPGWLDQCKATFEAHPELDLLGIEPPASRMPHHSQPFRRQVSHDLEMLPGPGHEFMPTLRRRPGECDRCGLDFKGHRRYVPCESIGGVGVFRRKAFEGRPLTPEGKYAGVEAWQRSHPQIVRGWIRPALKLFLLDRLPMEPWISHSKRYICKGWQRHWNTYRMEDAPLLWEWWAGKETKLCSV